VSVSISNGGGASSITATVIDTEPLARQNASFLG
jgi:hypothetical protein